LIEGVPSTAIGVIGAIGGQVFFIGGLASLFLSRFVPWMMFVEIIRELFRVDPSKAKKPKAAAKFKSKATGDVLQEAKATVKNRVRLTSSTCDNIVLFLEAVTKRFLCIRPSRFARIINEGMGQVRGELDIYNYMRKIRMTDAVTKALTTFN